MESDARGKGCGVMSNEEVVGWLYRKRYEDKRKKGKRTMLGSRYRKGKGEHCMKYIGSDVKSKGFLYTTLTRAAKFGLIKRATVRTGY